MSPYIAQAARRAELPISVEFFPGFDDRWLICATRQGMQCRYSARAATTAYLALVSTLQTESAERSPSAGTAPADPASLSPEEAL
jgi:hypothetical protein